MVFPPEVETIAPDAYPQMLSRPNAARALQALRAPATAEKAAQVMADFAAPMREAVAILAGDLEQAGADTIAIHTTAHEIRGCAGPAGLAVTGRIADGLCRYLDEAGRMGRAADPTLVGLHVSAIIRGARGAESEQLISDTVAQELAVLVARRLDA